MVKHFQTSNYSEKPRVFCIKKKSASIQIVEVYNFVHPSIHYLLVIRGLVAVSNPGKPRDTLQLLLRDPELFPGQKGYKIPPASSGPAQKATWKHPSSMPKPPQLTHLEVEK